MSKSKGLAHWFRGLVGGGGVHCPCCNDYHGSDKPKLGRRARRKAKAALKQEAVSTSE